MILAVKLRSEIVRKAKEEFKAKNIPATILSENFFDSTARDLLKTHKKRYILPKGGFSHEDLEIGSPRNISTVVEVNGKFGLSSQALLERLRALEKLIRKRQPPRRRPNVNRRGGKRF